MRFVYSVYFGIREMGLRIWDSGIGECMHDDCILTKPNRPDSRLQGKFQPNLRKRSVVSSFVTLLRSYDLLDLLNINCLANNQTYL
jgi:hypothetical protein